MEDREFGATLENVLSITDLHYITGRRRRDSRDLTRETKITIGDHTIYCKFSCYFTLRQFPKFWATFFSRFWPKKWKAPRSLILISYLEKTPPPPPFDPSESPKFSNRYENSVKLCQVPILNSTGTVDERGDRDFSLKGVCNPFDSQKLYI